MSLVQDTRAGQAATHPGPVTECKHIFVLFKMKLRVQVLTITARLEIAHKASSRDRWPRQNTLPFPTGQQAAPGPVLLGAGLSLGGMEATPPRTLSLSCRTKKESRGFLLAKYGKVKNKKMRTTTFT